MSAARLQLIRQRHAARNKSKRMQISMLEMWRRRREQARANGEIDDETTESGGSPDHEISELPDSM